MLLTETGLVFRGIRPLQKLGETARGVAMLNPFANISLNQRVPQKLEVVPPDPWPGDVEHGRELIAGVFRFAGQTLEREYLSWNPQYARPEWVSALHGFEWLRDLRSVGGDKARRMAREMVSSWIAMHDKPQEPAWRADIMGARIAAWITFHDFFCASADNEFRYNYFSSLLKQARYLSRSLRGDFYGVPLMKALKGLAYSGIALDEGEERLDQAFRLILKEIREQILPDGSHISRCPQSAFEFLQVLVDLRATMIAAHRELPEEIQHAIDRITPAVKFFRHTDGALAHFNGSQEGNPHICETTLMQSGARGRAMKSLPHGGYERISQCRSSIIMDVGVPHKSQYADRAHAGMLSFEFTYGRERVFVNCGTSTIQGQWREILRSTAAHTALTVDNRNACAFDDKGTLTGRPDVKVKRTEDEQLCSLEANHNGYVPRYGLTHNRKVILTDSGDLLKGEDILAGKSGVSFAVRFHLHPSIQASLIKEGEEILLRAKNGVGWRFKAEGFTLALEDSVYADEGESPRRSRQISISGETTGEETAVRWELCRDTL